MENQAIVHALRTAALHSGQPRRRPVGTYGRRRSARPASDFLRGESELFGEGWKSGQVAFGEVLVTAPSLRSPDKREEASVLMCQRRVQ